MNNKPKHDRTFWLIFSPLFVATLFIPVLPLYMGPREDVLMVVVPVWAFYTLFFMMPDYILLTVPIVYTHASITYLIARRLAVVRQNPIRFSVLALLSTSSLIAVCIAAISTLAEFGFYMFFLACLFVVTIANYFKCESVAGVPIPKMHQQVQLMSAILCSVMLLWGLAVAILRGRG